MATPSYTPIDYSSFLEFTGYRVSNAKTVADAYDFSDGVLFSPSSATPGIAVALVLPRANDPTTLLEGNWASRQHELADLRANGKLWATYGTDQAVFDAAQTYVTKTLGLTVLDSSNSNYVTSADSRTIWVAIDTQADFQALFNTDLRYSADADLYFWNGGLSQPDGLDLAGLWVDISAVPFGSNLAPGVSVTLPVGAQSLGNNAPPFIAGQTTNLVPQDMAAQYDFPLDGAAVQTKSVGLLEPAIGAALMGGQDLSVFQSRLTKYLTAIGQSGDGVVTVQGASGQNYDGYGGRAGERSLDTSVVAGVNPNSDIVLFTGSGGNGLAQGTTYAAIQSATFPGPGAERVSAWSDSFGDAQSMLPGSLFYKAYWELYVDTALANQTAVTALGDGGASELIGNGLTNLEYNCTQPYSLLVGGTSLSLLQGAQNDPTLIDAVLAPAKAGDLTVIAQLVAGGLSVLPANLTSDDFFLETAWNYYNVVAATDKGKTTYTIEGPPGLNGSGYDSNSATNGGVDPTQPVPSYQADYGLTPTTTDPLHQVGRGAPDVTADAGGNAFYQLADANMFFTGGYFFGTSAASPLWASLIVQIDTIFADQGLTDLGYAHDLLYTASAITPAAFNDVTMGNNIGSWAYGDSKPDQPYTSNGISVIPTGFGYEAGPGYDLVSGLGSPNGTILARTLSAIAHAQTSFADSPGVLEGGDRMGAAQSLLVQTISTVATTVTVTEGSHEQQVTSQATAPFAWTARLAEQALQEDFDPALVRLFDGYRQGALMEVQAGDGTHFGVKIDGAATVMPQIKLTNDFGFVDFAATTGQSVVHVAREVAIAETVGGHDDQLAVVRIRQNGIDQVSVTLFRVDDLEGTIDGLKPGDALYATAAQIRAYVTTEGGSQIFGAGYGNYTQTMLTRVDAGDLIAIRLTNHTTGNDYFSFAQANEVGSDGKHVGHAWNYGLNTWGFEDQYGGGDRDFNDLIIGLDFTSAVGQGWLI